MNKISFSTDEAPQAIGPYSQGLRLGNLFFVSGQIALDPATGVMVGDSIELQTERVMKNVAGVLHSAGLDWEHVVKTTIFLKDMSDFSSVNKIYGSVFTPPYPARATIGVSALPKDALVEIEVIAYFQD